MGDFSISSSGFTVMGPKSQCEVSPQELASLNDAKFSQNSEYNFKASEKMELLIGYCDLNLMQGFDESLVEVLRKTMINQEEMFRKQVYELHRLYWIQRSLMKNSSMNELDGYSIGKPLTRSMLGSFRNMKSKPVGTEQTSLAFPELVRRQLMYHNEQENIIHGGSSSRLQQRFLDVELPATHCFNNARKQFPSKVNGWNTPEKLREMKPCMHCETENSLNDVKLSLSIGRESWQNGGGRGNFSGKDTCISSRLIIDLEESTETALRGDVRDKSGLCSVSTPCSRDRQGSPVSIRSSQGFHNSSRMQSNSSLGVNSSSRGSKRCHDSELDLNRDLFDESACHTKVLSVSHKLVGEFQEGMCLGDLSWRKPDGSCSNQSCTLVHQDSMNSTLTASGTMSRGKIISGSVMYQIDVESASEMSPGHREEPDSHIGNSQHLNGLPPLNGNSRDEELMDIHIKKTEQVVPSPIGEGGDTVEDTSSNGTPASCKTNLTAQKFSQGKIFKTENDHEKSKLSCENISGNSETSCVAKCSTELESSLAIREEKTQSCQDSNEELAESDIMVRKGAISLVYFIEKSRWKSEIENKKKDQPECSSNSFESMVLKLPESNVDDHCISSKPFEVDDSSKRDSGIKLRRGRRIKDFHKDILPHLASLSSQEIYEDMKIMQGALRSRECKRLRTKMNNDQSKSIPVRSRRSKSQYVGRRY